MTRSDGVERFLFHAVLISLAGILALFISQVWVQGVGLISTLLVLALYELIRTRPTIQASLVKIKVLAWMPWVAQKASERMLRPIEAQTRTSALDFMIGLSIVWLTCPNEAVIIGCMVTAWADPCARELGKKFGKTKWFWSGAQKSYFGSATCLVVGFITASMWLLGLYGFSFASVARAGVIGLAAMGAELIPQGEICTQNGKILTPADNFWLILITTSVATIVTRGWA